MRARAAIVVAKPEPQAGFTGLDKRCYRLTNEEDAEHKTYIRLAISTRLFTSLILVVRKLNHTILLPLCLSCTMIIVA